MQPPPTRPRGFLGDREDEGLAVGGIDARHHLVDVDGGAGIGPMCPCISIPRIAYGRALH
jgi:hypothetical protein